MKTKGSNYGGYNTRARVANRADYSAELENKPGVFMMIPLESLFIDTEYQRPLTGGRVDKMASNWSWISCGALTVALRGPGSGNYYVMDGQHRLAAAIRSDMKELPCLVFESLTHVDEAQGFLDANTSRRQMTVVDRYRALLVTKDPVAIDVESLLKEANRVPSTANIGRGYGTPTHNGAIVSCIDFLLRSASLDSETLHRIWPLITSLCEGRLMTRKIISGMFYLEKYLTNTSLTERHWTRRILQVGYDALVKSIDETIAFEGKAGNAICSRGILRAINKGLRSKLKVEINNIDPSTEDGEE